MALRYRPPRSTRISMRSLSISATCRDSAMARVGAMGDRERSEVVALSSRVPAQHHGQVARMRHPDHLCVPGQGDRSCVKKNRNAETMLFIVGVGSTPASRCSIWNRRTSSAVAARLQERCEASHVPEVALRLSRTGACSVVDRMLAQWADHSGGTGVIGWFSSVEKPKRPPAPDRAQSSHASWATTRPSIPRTPPAKRVRSSGERRAEPSPARSSDRPFPHRSTVTLLYRMPRIHALCVSGNIHLMVRRRYGRLDRRQERPMTPGNECFGSIRLAKRLSRDATPAKRG